MFTVPVYTVPPALRDRVLERYPDARSPKKEEDSK
jgi:hypothetical protein